MKLLFRHSSPPPSFHFLPFAAAVCLFLAGCHEGKLVGLKQPETPSAPLPVESKRPGFETGGIYVMGGNAKLRGGTLAHITAEPESRIGDALKQNRAEGRFNLVQWGTKATGRKDKELDIPKMEQALAQWLHAHDTSLIDAIVMSEELHYNWTGLADAFYAAVKREAPGLAVYVWPSMPMTPTKMVPGADGRIMPQADGWVFDLYNVHYTEGARIYSEYLRTGKPFLACLSASPEREGGGSLISMQDQVALCMRYDLPVLYWASDPKSRSAGGWFHERLIELIPWRHQTVSTMRCQQLWKSGKVEPTWSDPIEIGTAKDGTISLEWPGIGPAFFPDFRAFIELADGARRLVAEESSFDYQLWSRQKIQSLVLEIQTTSPSSAFTVSVSRTGLDGADPWREVPARPGTGAVSYDLGAWQADRPGDYEGEVRVRVEVRGRGAFISKTRFTGTLLAKNPPGVSLVPAGKKVSQTIDFTSGSWRSFSEVEGADELAPDKPKREPVLTGLHARLNIPFHSSVPLSNPVLHLDGRTVPRDFGSSIRLGASLPGGEICWADPQVSDKGGWQSGEQVLDLGKRPGWQGIPDFTVHLELTNRSGKRGIASVEAKSLSISAEAAPVQPAPKATPTAR